MRVVVTGWVAGSPTAAFFWHAVSFALGFRDLGHEVFFLEDSGDHPWGWDVERTMSDPLGHAGSAFLARELAAVGLGGQWAYRHLPTGRCDGVGAEVLADVLADADVLVNVALTTPMRPEYLRIPHRLAVDADPVITQIRIAEGDPALAGIPETHTRLYTFGRPPLPAQRHEWVPTRQPVALDGWPVLAAAPAGAPFTAVSDESDEPRLTGPEVGHGPQVTTLEDLSRLVARSPVPLEMAVGPRPHRAEGQRLLATAGWQLRDSGAVTSSSAHYREFVRTSAGELGIAKADHIRARSGWFSDRTCCYLASGRPAVVQETGWSDWLPSGEGLLSFSTVDGAVAALREVALDPARHAAAARRIAEEHFRAADVCQALLDAL